MAGSISDFLANPDKAINVGTAVSILGKVCLFAAVGFVYHAGTNLDAYNNFELPALTISETEALQNPNARLPIQNYSIISSRNIFGTKKSAPAPKATAAPKSKLNLLLLGTNMSSSGDPFAIIEHTKKKKQDVFGLNEKVFDEATLIEVKSDRVSLSHNGETEVLLLAEGSSGGSSSSGGVEALDEDATEFSVAEEELENALANLPRLLSQARAVPYFRNGKSIGMRLFAIRRGSLYEKLGLKNGDIIKAVNESNISDPAQALKLFEQLKSERSIEVKLERQGQDKNLSYSID